MLIVGEELGWRDLGPRSSLGPQQLPSMSLGCMTITAPVVKSKVTQVTRGSGNSLHCVLMVQPTA